LVLIGEASMVRLSRMTDYAVVILCQMARERENAVLTAPYLAEATGLPLPSASKLLKLLAQKEIVRAQRGAAGGYSLARSADMISARDIVLALEGPVTLAACVDGGEGGCNFEPSCPIRGHWDPVNAAIHQALAKVSLTEMATPRPPFGMRFIELATDEDGARR
jgi:FeS assembly SUF system regulator